MSRDNDVLPCSEIFPKYGNAVEWEKAIGTLSKDYGRF